MNEDLSFCKFAFKTLPICFSTKENCVFSPIMIYKNVLLCSIINVEKRQEICHNILGLNRNVSEEEIVKIFWQMNVVEQNHNVFVQTPAFLSLMRAATKKSTKSLMDMDLDCLSRIYSLFCDYVQKLPSFQQHSIDEVFQKILESLQSPNGSHIYTTELGCFGYLVSLIEKTPMLQTKITIWNKKGVNNLNIPKDFGLYCYDFDSGNVTDTINNRLEQQSMGFIPSSFFYNNDDYFLTSIMLFKMKWSIYFPPYSTYQSQWNYFNGSKKECRFIHKEESTLYFEDDRNKAILIPYANSPFFYVVVLPNMVGEDSMKNLINDMSFSYLMSIFEEMDYQAIAIEIPKHSIVQKGETISQLFSENNLGANFPHVYDKTRIIIDEDGFEPSSQAPKPVFKCIAREFEMFQANRPYMFYVTDLKCNIILSGLVIDPNE